MLRIDAIVNHAHLLGAYKSLLCVVVPKLARDREDEVGHAIGSAPKDSLATWEPRQVLHLIAMLAMDDHRHAGDPCRRNSFDRPPISCVDNVRSKLLKNAQQAKKRKLQPFPRSARDRKQVVECIRLDKVGIEGPGRAETVLEVLGSQSRHEL